MTCPRDPAVPRAPDPGWTDSVAYVNGVVHSVALDADPLILRTPFRLRFDVLSLSYLVFSKFAAQLGGRS